ncbi:MAG TPA: histidine phosphatase family protein, partial [Solirubrobacteraceae bacterium]
MTIHLARHGQTAYNHEGRFQGHLPVPLDATGREQAAALAEVAAGVELVSMVCSPLRRARETADIVAARIGLEPSEDARFAETDTAANGSSTPSKAPVKLDRKAVPLAVLNGTTVTGLARGAADK